MSGKLRLFMLRDGKQGKPIEGLYFDSKMAAKRERDKHPGAVVSFGPDHKKYRG